VSSRRAAVFVDTRNERDDTMPTTITNVARLSDEVKSGQVYGVIQLYKLLGDKPALEKKPADIFARTYLTDALRTGLDQIRYKFTGQDRRGSLVFTGVTGPASPISCWPCIIP
jgi:hypothetical protein